jgi:hypothetical protein
MGANPTALAIIQISREIAIRIGGDATLRAEYIANTALDALGIIPHGSQRPPTAGMIIPRASGTEYDASRVDFLPVFWPFLVCHHLTSELIR